MTDTTTDTTTTTPLYEEGYIGSHAVPEHHRDRIAGRWTRINITQAEYRRILRGI